jgi:hypothetical protein
MKTARTLFLLLAVVGFLFSLFIHLWALKGRTPSSASLYVASFLGAFVLFVSAGYLSGAKAVGRGIPFKEIVKDCPAWLKGTVYFFSAYLGLTCLWVALRAPVIFHWRKVALPGIAGLALLSTFAMSFYVDSFSMLFGKLFGDHQEATSSERNPETT